MWILYEGGGYEVIAFETADEALDHMGYSKATQTVTRNLPDCVITDFDTESNYNGLDMLRACKGAFLPRIMVTGTTNMKEHVREAGGKEALLLMKPVEDEDLLKVVADAMLARAKENGWG